MRFPSWLSYARFRLTPTRARDRNDRLMVDTDPQPSGCGSGIALITTKRAYFHSQSLVLVFPSASALYSKTTATVFRRRKFGESL
jgi:hypothetical protein